MGVSPLSILGIALLGIGWICRRKGTLENDSGVCLIRPALADMIVKYADEHWEGRYRANMACLREGDRLIAIGDVQKLDPPEAGANHELVGTREAPLLVTTFTEEEVVRGHERLRVRGLGVLLVGVTILIGSFLL